MATKTTKTATKPKTTTKKSKVKDLNALFEDGLKDIYWAEKALVKELPKMEKKAKNPKLKKAISQHLQETEGHVSRLEDCFDALGKKATGKKCDAMVGLLEEAKGIMDETEEGAVRDAGIIGSAQKVEHYEIATYGTLAAYAKILKQEDCLGLLLETLDEEKKCDELLTGLADTNLNSQAME